MASGRGPGPWSTPSEPARCAAPACASHRSPLPGSPATSRILPPFSAAHVTKDLNFGVWLPLVWGLLEAPPYKELPLDQQVASGLWSLGTPAPPRRPLSCLLVRVSVISGAKRSRPRGRGARPGRAVPVVGRRGRLGSLRAGLGSPNSGVTGGHADGHQLQGPPALLGLLPLRLGNPRPHSRAGEQPGSESPRSGCGPASPGIALPV